MRKHHYKFTFKDSNGKLQYKTIAVDKQDNEAAIYAFEGVYPGEVWRRFEEVHPDRTQALANCEPIQVSQGVYDIAPEREEVET